MSIIIRLISFVSIVFCIYVFSLLHSEAKCDSCVVYSSAHKSSEVSAMPIWQWRPPYTITSSSGEWLNDPLFINDIAAVSKNRVLILYSKGGSYTSKEKQNDAYYLALLSNDGLLQWERNIGQPIIATRDRRYIVMNTNGLCAIALKHGQIALMSNSGKLSIAKLSKSDLRSNIVWNIDGSWLYCIDENRKLVGIDITSGATKNYPFRTEHDVNAITLSRNGNILASGDDGWISEHDIHGTKLWETKLFCSSINNAIKEKQLNQFSSQKYYDTLDIAVPLLELPSGQLFAISYNGIVASYDPSSRELVTLQLCEENNHEEGQIIQRPEVIANEGILYLYNGIMYCISDEGKMNWKYEQKNSYILSYSCADDSIVCVTPGKIVELDIHGNDNNYYGWDTADMQNSDFGIFDRPVVITSYGRMFACTNMGILVAY